MPKTATADAVDIAPWREWVRSRHAKYGSSELARILCCDESLVRRWVDGFYKEGEKVVTPTTISLSRVSELLSDTDTLLEDLYPTEVELESDGYCGRCHEVVTPIAGACPWCDTPVEDATGHDKRYCSPCDRLVTPANDGTCWRCGTMTKVAIPWDACECGCETMHPRFDQHGRRVKYVRGHAPRTLERSGTVAAEPFVRYLQDQLENLDVLSAIARMHAISREELVAVLSRTDELVDREFVRRALWTASRGGLGKGLKPHPDRPVFRDLYPDDVRSLVCPSCNGRKARHAEMCKKCRRRVPNSKPSSRAKHSLRDDLLTAMYRAYIDENLTQRDVAERFLDRTTYKNTDSLIFTFRNACVAKGWPLRSRTKTGVPSA